jgi:hypothetical protein
MSILKIKGVNKKSSTFFKSVLLSFYLSYNPGLFTERAKKAQTLSFKRVKVKNEKVL